MNSADTNPIKSTGLNALLTIGYGGKRSFDHFVALLVRNEVKYLVDVRTKPFSRFRPEYSKESLETNLKSRGIAYVFMGDTLGGMPSDPTCYTDGKVDYSKVRERIWFCEGLKRLEAGWNGGYRIAIMCAEIEPDRCHRSKLIGEALIARGIPVGHIDERGGLISHESAMARLNTGQASLFDVGYKSRRTYRTITNENAE